jgi:hypothetical protein
VPRHEGDEPGDPEAPLADRFVDARKGEFSKRAYRRASGVDPALVSTTEEQPQMTYRDPEEQKAQERDKRAKAGAEGGESEAARKPPAAPADDSSPVGDTDQHSDADA